jgi:hypothetical protein
MKRLILVLMLSLLVSTTWAGECQVLQSNGLRLLARTTYEVNYPGLLKGCFTGYLPEGMPQDNGLYRFGIFKDGRLTVPFPVIEAGMDLSSSPYQHLKIFATSFADLDHDGKRDVAILGSNLAAKGELVFAQVFWNCGDRFVFDEKMNSDLGWYIGSKGVITIKAIQQYIRAHKLKASCEGSSGK